MPDQKGLSFEDQFSIFTQLNLHQRRIDAPLGLEPAQKYVDLYWPEGRFIVNDLRQATFEGFSGLKQMYDYAHSVFPLGAWFHTMGPFEITGDGTQAWAQWRWQVNWKAEHEGVVSTGTYEDRFEKRGGLWKCLERISRTDPNWPATLFQQYIDRAGELSKES